MVLNLMKSAQVFPRKLIRVSSFVDWNSQLLLTGIEVTKNPVDAARLALQKTTKNIAKCLVHIDGGVNFQISMRLYHGWHKGYEPTANLRAVRQVISETDFSTASDKQSVSFSGSVGLGNCLISALPRRMHEKLGIHLPNTLRCRDRGRGRSELEEKMVDTALATDLVVSAFLYPEEWIVLVTEDDDLMPPLFTAESLVSLRSSRVVLLSKRRRSNKFLRLDGLEG